jgi:hypothetical protein
MKQVNGEEFLKVVEKHYKTEPMTFHIPLNGGHKYRFNECVDQIATLIDLYFHTDIQDVGKINDLVDQEIVDAMRREVKMNELDDINGGSK